MTFLLKFLRLLEEVETLGKNGGASRHTKKLQGSPYDYGIFFLLTPCCHVYSPQSTGDVLTQSSLPSSLSISVHYSKSKL